MLGKILGMGVIRGEDGARYTFDLSDIKNIGAGGVKLDGVEVDFEPQDGKAVEIFVTGDVSQIKKESFCYELDFAKGSPKYQAFYGIVDKAKKETTSQHFSKTSGGGGYVGTGFGGGVSGKINAIKGIAADMLNVERNFKMGNTYFEYDGGNKQLGFLMGNINPMLAAATPMLNKTANIEDNDEIAVITKINDGGTHEVVAIKNFTRGYVKFHQTPEQTAKLGKIIFWNVLGLSVLLIFVTTGLSLLPGGAIAYFVRKKYLQIIATEQPIFDALKDFEPSSLGLNEPNEPRLNGSHRPQLNESCDSKLNDPSPLKLGDATPAGQISPPTTA